MDLFLSPYLSFDSPYYATLMARISSSPLISVQFSRSVRHNSANPWTAACQASLSIINSRSLLKLLSIGSVMSSNHFIFCYPLLLLPSVFPSIKVFSNESGHHITLPKYWSFSFSISPSNEYLGLISFRITCFDLLAVQSKGLSKVFSNTTARRHQCFGAQHSLWSNSHIHSWLLEKPYFE